MQPYAKSFLTAAVLLVPVGLWAQEVYHSPDPDLLARLSYDSSAVVQGEGVRHICVAVSRDGDYRIVRIADFPFCRQPMHFKSELEPQPRTPLRFQYSPGV
jgi:hypothetical protein